MIEQVRTFLAGNERRQRIHVPGDGSSVARPHADTLVARDAVVQSDPPRSLAPRTDSREANGATCIFPGSFHPLHFGHVAMVGYARQRLGSDVEFEISVTNVDKRTLTNPQVVDRLRQFPGQLVWLTRAATFAEKAALFPGVTFLVGADTVIRLCDPRYYLGHQQMLSAWERIAAANCRFLAFGRLVEQAFLAEPSLPPQLQRLTEFVPEHEFRRDISSTSIRRQHGKSD